MSEKNNSSQKESKNSTISKTGLGKILETFSVVEFQNFEAKLKLLPSKTGKTYLKLLKIFLHQPDLDKFQTYQKLFPKLAFNENRFDKLVSKLRKEAEQFLVNQKLNTQQFVYQKLLLEAFEERGLYDFFKQKNLLAQKRIRKKKVKQLADYLNLFQLNRQLFFNPNTPKFKNGVESLGKMSDSLDRFFSLAKLMLKCENQIRKKSLGIDENLLFPSEVLDIANQESTNISFEIYFKLYQLLNKTEADIPLYLDLQKRFSENLNSFPKPFQTKILQILLNYSNVLINQGHLNFIAKQFELYQIGLENQLFIIKGNYPSAAFINFVVTACMSQNFEAAQQFIQKNKSILKESEKDFAHQISIAYLAFYQKNYEKATDFLANLQPSGWDEKLRFHSLAVRCFTEYFLLANNHSIKNTLQDKLRNFKRFIERTEALKAKRQAYLNMIEIVKTLLKNNSKSQETRQKIHNDFRQRLLQSPSEIENSLYATVAKIGCCN